MRLRSVLGGRRRWRPDPSRGHHQCRQAQGVQLLSADIHAPDRVPGAEIAGGGRRANEPGDPVLTCGLAAMNSAENHRAKVPSTWPCSAVLADCGEAVIPHLLLLRRRLAGAGTAEHQAAQHLAVPERQHLPDHPARSRVRRRELAVAELGDEMDHVVGELLQRIAAAEILAGCIALPVAAHVVGEYAVMLREQGQLIAPHRVIDGERMAEHDQRPDPPARRADSGRWSPRS